MSGKPEPKDLEAVLAKLETEWQELAARLKTQAQVPNGRDYGQVRDRLEKLERRYRRQRVFGAVLLGLVLVLLSTQVFLLDRFFFRRGPLEVASPAGRDQPQFNLYSKLQKLGRTETNTPGDTTNQGTRTGITTGTEEGTLASVPDNKAEAKEQAAEAEAVYVGSKTSNKYHYPTCRWVKQIRPENLLKFKSVHDAREQCHEIPCPACRPPRAD